ncbi:hypothetical protein W97_03817 [Coniosporium apollinis CBS 100218]|uniref:C2H2-type domain-containing protein n=1 Tax=Coniosporium apollinis (strain CBS 100218) TaxID=1168221 RepID=R7YS07_CONA1|nr:uncharacterized protein W97_03817 [Coniosporium apollinis CBS 100218]EON64584.1 hypothetical protein W97_03817 [Coniosporium apollinis CBS 100218]
MVFHSKDAHQYYADLIRERFLEAAADIVDQLGRSNWERYKRISAERSANVQDSKFPGDASAEDFLVAGKALSEVTASRFQDSGLGSSLPTKTDYAPSMTSYFSSLADGDRPDIPALPDEARRGMPFECDACGRMIRVTNKRDWKWVIQFVSHYGRSDNARKHIYQDLKPYVCFYPRCAYNVTPFENRELWVDHLRLEHSLVSTDAPFECVLCPQVHTTGRGAISTHLARHMEEISLAALPRGTDSEVGSEDGSLESQKYSVTSGASGALDPTYEWSVYGWGNVGDGFTEHLPESAHFVGEGSGALTSAASSYEAMLKQDDLYYDSVEGEDGSLHNPTTTMEPSWTNVSDDENGEDSLITDARSLNHKTGHVMFTCYQCQAKFPAASELDEHARTEAHAAYACSETGCTSTFSRHDVYERHETNHLRETPRFPCPHCKKHRGMKGFKRKDYLKRHLRHYHHIGEKETQVAYRRSCGHKDCSGNDDLEASEYTTHMRKVHDESDFPCLIPGCNRVKSKGYFRRRDLDKHQRKEHPQIFEGEHSTTDGGDVMGPFFIV